MQKLPSPYRPRALAPITRVPGLDYDVLDARERRELLRLLNKLAR